jgi:hypothetical protein
LFYFSFLHNKTIRHNVTFQKLFEQLCKYWDLNPNEIIVKFFDDIKSKQWTTWAPQGKFNESGGLYNQIFTTEEKRFNIQLAESNLDNLQLLVSVNPVLHKHAKRYY